MERRLAAILAADVVGYSRLIEGDEAETLAALKSHRKALIDPKIDQYHGRIVKLMGDGLLAEFPSAVEAVQCAVEIQHAIAERNADVPEERRITFRVGINIGDIVVEDDDIFGDGVNIAARLERLAHPGGICISRPVYTQIADKLDLEFEDLGEQRVKNITKPVTVYRVALDNKAAVLITPVIQGAAKRKHRRWLVVATAAAVLILVVGGTLWWQPWTPDVEPASVEAMAFPLPDKASIAVLPFDNLSGDAGQHYLADGLTESVIAALVNIPELFVIARNSSFTYKGKAVRIRQVAQELGVRYVLEGSIQRTSDRIRVTAQLIDAVQGNHLWSQRYDRELSDLFVVQDEITLKIVSALHIELTEGEFARLAAGATRNLDAWKDAVEGLVLLRRFTKEDMHQARRLFERAIERDPAYAFAHVSLGWTHWNDVRMTWSPTPEQSLRLAQEAVETALAIDPKHSGAHGLMGAVYLLQGEHDEAIEAGHKSIELAPSVAEHYAVLAISTYYAGDFKETVRLTKKAMRLHPHHPVWYDYRIAVAHMMLGEHDEATQAMRRWLDDNPDSPGRKISMALVLSMAGRVPEAQELVTEARTADPSITLENAAKRHRFRDTQHLQRILSALRAAGVPD